MVGTTVSDPLVGRLLDGRYRVGARLARGGMATVYAAIDTRLERTVALKVMHPHLAQDDEFVSRFIREARAAARLSHPNVVAVFDQGTDGETVFLAMELVEGRTLRDLLHERGRLRPREAFDVLEPVLAALAAAHQAGIIHRDVKPENVLLADDGRVKVADFGLARAITSATTHTSQGVLIGTVAYLSPEQVQRGVADARSDVYSAGILLFEMLTGTKPYAGDSPIQVAYRHVHDDVPRPSSRVHNLPAAVDELVTRSTNRDPDQRPADAMRFLSAVGQVKRTLSDADLDATTLLRRIEERNDTTMTPLPAPWESPAAQSAYPVLTPPETPWEPPPPTAPQPRRRRRRGLVALLLVLLLAAGAGAGAWWLGSGRFTAVPGVLNLERAVAAERLQQAGLEVQWAGRAYDERVPAGHVISTDPRPNDRIERGGTVHVVLSRGKLRIPVPPLRGLTAEQAERRLVGVDLVMGDQTKAFSDTVAKGDVISSTPARGVELRQGAAVAIVVSKGVEPVAVPSVEGMPVEEASVALERLEFQVATKQAYSDTVDEGLVIKQRPAGGKQPKGSTVRLTVSRGPQLFDVPNVTRLPLAEAESVLAGVGFKVRVLSLPGGPGDVLAQSPAAGSMHPRGTTVTLSVW